MNDQLLHLKAPSALFYYNYNIERVNQEYKHCANILIPAKKKMEIKVQKSAKKTLPKNQLEAHTKLPNKRETLQESSRLSNIER